MHGMPSTAGRLGFPGMLLNDSPEFGTVWGTQTPVNWSSSSPPGHWATGTEALGTANTEIAGATATATANPPARISLFESSRVAIVTLSVVIDQVVGKILGKLNKICIRSTSSLGKRPLGLRISANYGLELMVDRGTGCGPSSSAFSARPMHAPESPPVQGNPCGEFGTSVGVHTVV